MKHLVSRVRVLQEVEHGLSDRADGTGWWSLRGYRNERPMEQIVQMLTWDDCAVHEQFSSSGIRETQGCESTHSTRGHEGLLHAVLGNGSRTANLEGAWRQSTSC